MDIQIENTPPKKFQGQNPSTPPRHYDTQAYNTPVKRKHQVTTPVKGSGQNPQSKKFKILHSIQKPSNSSNRQISEFNLSRLEKDYIYERKLGEGNFSFVGLYKSRMTGDFFAVKITKSSKMSVNEVQALGALSILSQRCKNIVRYFHSWVENNELHLVMEYCKESLTTLLDRQRYSGLRFKEEFIKNVLKQSLQGLKTMHENKMVHLDLKPDNLLIKENVIKISDLGLTRLNHLKRASELDEGDSRYLAREILNYYPSIDLTKADIFSLGLTIFEMLSLEPLPNNGEYWVSIRDHGLSLTDRMDLQQYSSELLSLVEQMIHPDWSCRPSASALLQSPLLKDQFPRKNRMMVFITKSHKNRKNQSSL